MRMILFFRDMWLIVRGIWICFWHKTNPTNDNIVTVTRKEDGVKCRYIELHCTYHLRETFFIGVHYCGSDNDSVLYDAFEVAAQHGEKNIDLFPEFVNELTSLLAEYKGKVDSYMVFKNCWHIIFTIEHSTHAQAVDKIDKMLKYHQIDDKASVLANSIKEFVTSPFTT